MSYINMSSIDHELIINVQTFSRCINKYKDGSEDQESFFDMLSGTGFHFS